MRTEDKIRVKAQVEKIKGKPVQTRTKEETDYCIRKQYIIESEEEDWW